MPFSTSAGSPLLQKIDSIIEAYGHVNPQLLHDLKEHRAALEEALKAQDRRNAARLVLQLASWVKWCIDSLPD